MGKKRSGDKGILGRNKGIHAGIGGKIILTRAICLNLLSLFYFANFLSLGNLIMMENGT